MKSFDEATILNPKLYKVRRCQLIEYIFKATQLEKTLVVHVNIKGTNFAYDLPWYRDFLNNSDFVFCDRLGVVVGDRMINAVGY